MRLATITSDLPEERGRNSTGFDYALDNQSSAVGETRLMLGRRQSKHHSDRLGVPEACRHKIRALAHCNGLLRFLSRDFLDSPDFRDFT